MADRITTDVDAPRVVFVGVPSRIPVDPMGPRVINVIYGCYSTTIACRLYDALENYLPRHDFISCFSLTFTLCHPGFTRFLGFEVSSPERFVLVVSLTSISGQKT